MGRHVKLLLVRHGETVDNVAQLYAGSRDSALTNHGYQQANRLGKYLSTLGFAFAHIFSSPLQRAVQTATLIREAQVASSDTRSIPHVKKIPALREQDFGYLEGKKWTTARPAITKSGPDLADVESKTSMVVRADQFLDSHLLPLLDQGLEQEGGDIVVISHGVFLSTLWKRLLARFPPKYLSLSPELQATARPNIEYLGGWSNTGYLEVCMVPRVADDVDSTTQANATSVSGTAISVPDPSAQGEGLGEVNTPTSIIENAVTMRETQGRPTGRFPMTIQEGAESFQVHQSTNTTTPESRLLHGYTMVIMKINAKDHLTGLKRTGGGVGSSRHDSSQRNIESFFKRRKAE